VSEVSSFSDVLVLFSPFVIGLLQELLRWFEPCHPLSLYLETFGEVAMCVEERASIMISTNLSPQWAVTLDCDPVSFLAIPTSLPLRTGKSLEV
jgi:hypothetical protein